MAAQNFDFIVIGAGHNGLVTAAYLAKAGKKVLVLERRPIVGGIAVSEEIFTGFKYSTCAHLAGSFAPEIIADLGLKKHGLEILPLSPLLFAPSLDSPPLIIPANQAQAAEQIGRLVKSDGQRYPRLLRAAEKTRRVSAHPLRRCLARQDQREERKPHRADQGRT